jgi:hypothetical protein
LALARVDSAALLCDTCPVVVTVAITPVTYELTLEGPGRVLLAAPK